MTATQTFGRVLTAARAGETTWVSLDDGSSTGAADWYVLKGEKEWRMPCGESGIFMAETPCPHRILVWPSEDDPNLRKATQALKEEDGESGKVLAYEKSMGAAVSFYEARPS